MEIVCAYKGDDDVYIFATLFPSPVPYTGGTSWKQMEEEEGSLR